jgi:saccharopine dehydrogenase-like NADP-dependent oxidoreductase
MKVLLLGVGMQGKAALHDLFHNPSVTEIVAADMDRQAVADYIAAKGYGAKAGAMQGDASSDDSLSALIGDDVDVVIDLLPPMFVGKVAKLCVEKGVPLVNTFYAIPEVKALEAEARKKGVTILPEFGMDPGIDLVLLGEAVRSLDEVEEIMSYGAGFPEPAAADNAIKYKVTWTFEGVLNSYKRAGRVIRDGEIIAIEENEMFAKKNIHEIDVNGLGRLEAFPNGDVIKYVDLLGLDAAKLKNMGRYVLRWPGHCEFWHTMAGLGLLDDGSVSVDGVKVDRKKYLANALKDQIQYKEKERDVVLVRIEVRGKKDGKNVCAVYQAIDKRDLDTGFTAMSRTVGFTAAIGATLLAGGKLRKGGILSPVTDIPYDLFKAELIKRNIEVTESITIEST